METVNLTEESPKYQNLNYSEKLFLNRCQERKKKIDQAFNSISDTNDQQQITQALKLVTDVNERKILLSKIIKRKKEIQEMKEMNTINSLAPLFAKIKQKFFNNLYKKTGNRQHFLQGQGKSNILETSMNSSSKVQSDNVNEDSLSDNESNRLEEQSQIAQSPLNAPVNTPLIDSLNISKKQHLFNALTLLATRSQSNKKKTQLLSTSQQGRFAIDGSQLELGNGRLQYLTKDPNIFKAGMNFQKEQNKINEKNNTQETQLKEEDGNKKKQTNQSTQNNSKVKSKIDSRLTQTQFKNQILTNHTSLKNIINYQNRLNKRPSLNEQKLFTNKSTSQQNPISRSKLNVPILITNSNNYDDNNYWEPNDQPNIRKKNLTVETKSSLKSNPIFQKSLFKSSENSFTTNDYFLEDEKISDAEGWMENTGKSYDFKNRRASYNNQFTKGTPKVSNFGGVYYYLGKKIPESNLYRFIVQCEQKRMYQKSEGNLFSNKPFTYDLNSINQISHIHKLVDSETNQVDILELKHYGSPQSNTIKNSTSLYMKMGSTPSSTRNQNKGLPLLSTNSFLTQRQNTDNSCNFTSRTNCILNNAKDSDSIMSYQNPDYVKYNHIQGFYSPKINIKSADTKLKKQFFANVINEE